MPNVVVVGAQWGDEGKAKVIDYLTERSDVIIRFQGGANAGHTVIANGEKFVFHLVPSGVMYPDKVCVVGNGVVFDPEQFLTEIDALAPKGLAVDGRLFVSELAHLVMPYHKLLDRASESQMAGGKIGTTVRGIGPAYADKAARTGLRVCDLMRWDLFAQKLASAFAAKKFWVEHYLKAPFDLDFDQTVEQFRTYRERLRPFVADTSAMIYAALRANKRLLFEGAQGTFLDIDHGTYPYVTSSNTTAGAAAAGSGIGPTVIDHVIGIVKMYTTRVGNGPFPTELTGSIGERIRTRGDEFGATTGRPRRCGWIDTVMLRRAAQLNGLTRLALTKLDVLDDLAEISICTHYEINGRRVDLFPADPQALEHALPVYETVAGWQSSTSHCSRMADLPSNAVKYIEKLQGFCYGIPILMLSLGPDRTQTIEIERL